MKEGTGMSFHLAHAMELLERTPWRAYLPIVDR